MQLSTTLLIAIYSQLFFSVIQAVPNAPTSTKALLRKKSAKINQTLTHLLPPDLKIVGGKAVKDGGAPHQIALYHREKFICGGSLIRPRVVLTAAHCVYESEHEPSKFKVIYGSLDRTAGNSLSVSRIIRHPAYNDDLIDNDIALLHLATNFTPGTNAALIELTNSTPAVDSRVTVTGWGMLWAEGVIPAILQIADDLRVVNSTECAERWAAAEMTEITPGMLCAHSTSQASCNGDSGGPLTQDGILVGVVSWGDEYCLSEYYPSVYTNVTHFREWILTNSSSSPCFGDFFPIISDFNYLQQLGLKNKFENLARNFVFNWLRMI